MIVCLPSSNDTKAQTQPTTRQSEASDDARQNHFPSPVPPPAPLPPIRGPVSRRGGGGGMRTAAVPAPEAHQSRLLYELCALLLTILRPPGDHGPRPWPRHVTAAGAASMLLGASVALMLCGSVTFMLGFFLMPWVVGLACVFLFVGFVTNLSGIGRAILCWPAAYSSSPKEASTWHIFPKPPFMQM